ncbi:MAG: hypothetical protein K0R31_1362 [Clostridiales bacterium]|nr:hypothetical protein [Clostridiales bacterium]
MSYLKERVSYLKGLADGMQINESTNEGKLLKAIIEVLDDISLSVEDIEEVQEELSEQVDSIDEDLAEIERIVFEEDDCCDCDDEEDSVIEIECPHCQEEVEIDLENISDDDTVECPSCHEKIEIEWDCDCGEHHHEE